MTVCVQSSSAKKPERSTREDGLGLSHGPRHGMKQTHQLCVALIGGFEGQKGGQTTNPYQSTTINSQD
jgi:hypothetical protein